jgi:iron-sulfur cluster repair protein YtfE (RIC family)
MKPVITQLTPETTVNDAIARWPALLTVLSAYGIDSCCGGALPIGEAARKHQVDLDELIQSLHVRAAEQPGPA